MFHVGGRVRLFKFSFLRLPCTIALLAKVCCIDNANASTWCTGGSNIADAYTYTGLFSVVCSCRVLLCERFEESDTSSAFVRVHRSKRCYRSNRPFIFTQTLAGLKHFVHSFIKVTPPITYLPSNAYTQTHTHTHTPKCTHHTHKNVPMASEMEGVWEIWSGPRMPLPLSRMSRRLSMSQLFWWVSCFANVPAMALSGPSGVLLGTESVASWLQIT